MNLFKRDDGKLFLSDIDPAKISEAFEGEIAHTTTPKEIDDYLVSCAERCTNRGDFSLMMENAIALKHTDPAKLVKAFDDAATARAAQQ